MRSIRRVGLRLCARGTGEALLGWSWRHHFRRETRESVGLHHYLPTEQAQSANAKRGAGKVSAAQCFSFFLENLKHGEHLDAMIKNALRHFLFHRLASIEIIKKTMPKRRQERAVELLTTVSDSTAACIAVGDISRDTQNCHPFLRKMAYEHFRSNGLFTSRCNTYQEKAIRNAFIYPISLIWGPPGTGKTMTGELTSGKLNWRKNSPLFINLKNNKF